MERSKAKKAGRKKLTREKGNALKDKPPQKAPAKEAINQAGRYHAIETAKKQFAEAQQAIAPDREQQPYTAVDKVETYTANAAHEVLQALPSAGKPRQHTDNPFHRETDFQEEKTRMPKPQKQMRRGINATTQKNATGYRSSSSKTLPSVQTTGQRQMALPRNTSTVSTSGDFFKKLGAAVTKAVTPSREALLYAAGAFVLIIVPFMVIIGVASMLTSSGEGRSAYVPVSPEVEAYRPLIRLYAAQYGIPEYEDLIAAVMMQESGGQGTDPMQCSESGYNTRYPHAPNSITDPEYSIDVGVHTLADVLNMAGVESLIDLDRISLALQGYNFGPGYISWALANYGGYSELNAIEFSDMMAAQYGWAGYGDKVYVSHVLRYYPVGQLFIGEGNAAMVVVAQSQIGNVGGAPYWSWWGYNDRVEWCTIFVSWVADQCGYIETGVLPKAENVNVLTMAGKRVCAITWRPRFLRLERR